MDEGQWAGTRVSPYRAEMERRWICLPVHRLLMSAVSGMFASVAGWACLLVGQRKLLEGLDKKKEEPRLQHD